MNLTALEGRLLQYLDLRADEDKTEVARKLKVPQHKLHYALSRMYERELVQGNVALIDYGRLGYTPYSVLLGVAPFGDRQRQLLTTFFSRMPQVAWASEVLGSAQISLQALLTSPFQVSELLRSLQKKVEVKIISKEIAVRHSLVVFERRYLSSEKIHWPREQISLNESGNYTGNKALDLDEIDWKCISAISVPHTDSYAAIARSLSLPAQTFHRRIQALKSKGVLRGYMHALRLRNLGVRRFKLLVSTTGYDPELEKSLHHFAASNPHVTNFVVCLGQWDFEISMETFDDRAVTVILGSMGEKFGNVVRDIRILPVLDYFKFSFQMPKSLGQQ